MVAIENRTLEAFAKMWGLFPAPVLLIHASREILAVNECAKGLGIPAGIKCHSLYPSETPCPGCLANKALMDNAAVRRCCPGQKLGQIPGRLLDSRAGGKRYLRSLRRRHFGIRQAGAAGRVS